MGQAVGYARAQWTALTRYADNGALAIDNNVAERALRKVVTGRNNWTFCGSDAGGERAAILYSVVATCRAHAIDPCAYLREVLERIPAHPDRRRAELPAAPVRARSRRCRATCRARVERPQAGRLRGRRHVESEEPERDVQQPPSTRDLRMHQASASQSQGAGRVFGVMTSGMCQA